MTDKLHIDFETYCDLDVKVVGGRRYSEHESCEILMMGWQLNDEEVEIWLPGEPLPDLLEYHLLYDEDTLVYAFNANFEKSIVDNVATRQLGWPKIALERYRDPAAVAASLALPFSLEKLADALELPVNKDKRGKALIRKFSMPNKPTKLHPTSRWLPEEAPEDWEAFKSYCKDDVVTEHACAERLKEFELIPDELATWQLDSIFNNRGIPIDIPTVETCIKVIDEYSGNLVEEVEDITGGLRPTQRDKILTWVEEQGESLPNLQAATLDKYLKENEGSESLVYRVMKIRRSLGRSSTKKLQSMIKAKSEDNRVRGTLLYHGATTGRWGGRLIQPQNFPRPTLDNPEEEVLPVLQTGDLGTVQLFYDDPMEAVSSCLRSMICAPEGKDLIVSDYSSIEARVVCWLAGQENAVRQYHKGVCVYTDMAAYVYSESPKRIKKGSIAYQLGKAIILGCGFGMGVATFLKTCESWGIPIDKQLAEKAVYGYRNKYHKVKQYWHDIENAVIRAVKTKKIQTVGKVRMGVKDMFFFMVLPSGRRLAYPYPKVVMKETSWGENKQTLSFLGSMPNTVHWGNNYTYGGKLVENIVQATARDLMVSGMKNAEKEGYKVLTSIHDELVTEVDEGWGSVEEFEEIICRLPNWAEGFPLAASDGYRGKRYRK